MNNTKATGNIGEDYAVTYLQKLGHTILARNVFLRWAEIDIVTKHQDTVFFIEVKFRRNHTYGEPQESVHWRKQRKIMLAGEYYAQRLRKKGMQWKKLKIGVMAITQKIHTELPETKFFIVNE